MLLSQVVHQFEDADGIPHALAQLRAYLTGTTTPTPVYSDSGLTTPITQPVTADTAGIFPKMYLDPSISTRIKIIVAGGDFNNPLIDVDPVNYDTEVTEDDLADGAIEAKLGYTPVAEDGSVSFTAPQRYQFDPDPPTAFHEDDLGYMGAPVVTKDADYTFVLGDTGKAYMKTDANARAWTIPPNSSVAFPVGHKILVWNAGSAGAITLTRGSGVVLYLAGALTDADKSVASGGFCVLQKMATNTWLCHGASGVT